VNDFKRIKDLMMMMMMVCALMNSIRYNPTISNSLIKVDDSISANIKATTDKERKAEFNK
jgi:hypothetical protein